MDIPTPTPTRRPSKRYFRAADATLMSPRVQALCHTVSKLRAALTASAQERGQLEAILRARAARIVALEHDLAKRDAELARLRREWVPRRVMDACVQIDGAKVREYV